MGFAEIELKRIDRIVGTFCKDRTLKEKLKIGYRIQDQDVLIYEKRPKWDNPKEFSESAIAKVKFVRTANTWELYWQRGNLKWVRYDLLPSSKELRDLVNAICKDEFGCFFG